MKVFIRSNTKDKRPEVVGFYDDNADIPADAHPGTRMEFVPSNVLVFDARPELLGMGIGTPRLPADWKERAASYKPGGAAASQTAMLREMIEQIFAHGSDTTKWPSAAKKRLDAINKAWPKP